jgi:hypothetical protein
MNRALDLNAGQLLARVAEQVPLALRANVVVIGSIATAWQFRDVSGTSSVATKDIDLLLRPSIDAVATAQILGQELLEQGWQPQFPSGRHPGKPDTPEDQLPVLRLTPPRDEGLWFVELLAEPPPGQTARKHWTRFHTESGDFVLPSFRYMRVAVHHAEETGFGLRVARPARMALAHLLEHAEPDRTPISSLPGQPPRFTKDVGRAISLWWLAREQSAMADRQWLGEWGETAAALSPDGQGELAAAARKGLMSVSDYLREAHAIAVNGVLAPHQTTQDSWRRAFAGLGELIDKWEGMP